MDDLLSSTGNETSDERVVNPAPAPFTYTASEPENQTNIVGESSTNSEQINLNLEVVEDVVPENEVTTEPLNQNSVIAENDTTGQKFLIFDQNLAGSVEDVLPENEVTIEPLNQNSVIGENNPSGKEVLIFDRNLAGSVDGDWLYGDEGKDLIYLLDGSDIAFSGNNDDYIDGGEDNDYLFAEAGNDIIFGGNGDDYLNGGEGNDTIFGDAGDDIIYGESGDDMIAGGAGFDRFFYATGLPFTTTDFGVDTLTDFTTGEDKIVLDKHTFGALTSDVGVGFSNPTDFAIVASDVEVEGSNAAIVYNITTGNLFYNQNGAEVGFGTGGLFASLSGIPNISSHDFEIKPPLEA